jgi:hypothetical protein
MLGRVPPNGLTLNCAAALIGKGFEPLSTYQIDTILLAAQRRHLECTCWAAQPLRLGTFTASPGEPLTLLYATSQIEFQAASGTKN